MSSVTNTVSSADLLPEARPMRFGLQLVDDDFEQLREELERIREAERSAELAAATFKLR